MSHPTPGGSVLDRLNIAGSQEYRKHWYGTRRITARPLIGRYATWRRKPEITHRAGLVQSIWRRLDNP